MNDLRESPAYTIAEAAHYLAVPATTIRYWSVGRDQYAPLVAVSRSSPTLLSFLDLAELHVLSALRREHKLRMPGIRRAISYLSRQANTSFEKRHPLIGRVLETDGLDLFTEYYGELTNVSREGQSAMRDIISVALRRIDRDPNGIPIKFYPFTRHSIRDAPASVVIDPALSAGRPVIAGTGLATQIIAERYKLGESICDLAYDYERPNADIEEAIRCEFAAIAA